MALIATVTGTTLLVLTTLPTSSIGRLQTVQLGGKNSSVAQYFSKLSEGSAIPARLFALEGPRSDTASAFLDALNALASAHPSMASQFADAQKFSSALPSGLATPHVWTDGDTEVVLEWISGERHAVVSFEGDGNFGYAMKQGSRFNPGQQSGNCDRPLPTDLLKYIAEI